jgi:hypothetical protein
LNLANNSTLKEVTLVSEEDAAPSTTLSNAIGLKQPFTLLLEDEQKCLIKNQNVK